MPCWTRSTDDLRKRRARALAAWADPAEVSRLETPRDAEASGGRRRGSATRYDARQKQVHRQTNRFWPQALGTTPWGCGRGGCATTSRRPGRYRVRLVDDTSTADVTPVIAPSAPRWRRAGRCRWSSGRWCPRHYVLALRADGPRWRVYEPTSGQVRLLDLAAVRRGAGRHRCWGSTGWHAVLLPS